jgi:hypothetical protein
MKKTLLLLAFILPISIFAQYKVSRAYKNALPFLDKQYNPWGFFVEPGLNYNFNFPGTTDSNNLVPSPEFDYSGGVGGHLSGGVYKFVKNNTVIKYFDFGLSADFYSGKESLNDEYLDTVTNLINTGERKFSRLDIGAFGSIHFVNNLNNKYFLDHSIGLSFNFRVLNNSDGDTLYPNINNVGNDLSLDAYYKFGFGIRLKNDLVLIPSIKIPLTTFLNDNDFNPSFDYYNTRQYPLTLSVKIMWLRKARGKKCIIPEKNPFEVEEE